MKPNTDFKRISFLLDSKTATLLEEASVKAGVSKSKLIKSWIKSTDKIGRGFSSKDKLTHDYNLRLSITEIRMIEDFMLRHSLGFSEILRRIIHKNLTQSAKTIKIQSLYQEDPSSTLKKLWMKGSLNDISSLLGSDIEKLNIEELVILARAQKEMGQLDNALNTTKLLKNLSSKILDFEYRIRLSTAIKLIEIDVNLYKRDVGKSKLLLDQLTVENPESIDRGMAGLFNCQLGEMASFSENYEDAIKYFEKALDYLDLWNHPTLMLRIYMRLSRTYEYFMNYEYSQKYCDKAYEINKKINNKLYWGWYYADQGVLSYLKGDENGANEAFDMGLKYYKQIGSEKGACSIQSHKGRILLYKNKLNEAYSALQEASDIEDKFRDENAFSYIKLCKWFIESKDNFEKAFSNIKTMHDKHLNEYEPSLGNYFMYATEFINSTDNNLQEDGRENLSKLSLESHSKLVSFASQNVINTGLLQAIR